LAERRSRFDELEEALDDTKDNLEKEIRRRAVLEERERLTRDIHDGVGGQLLGLMIYASSLMLWIIRGMILDKL